MTPATPQLGACFWQRHVFWIPAGLAIAAMLAQNSPFDHWLSQFFFDSRLGRFPAHDWAWLELIGHHIAKNALTLVWLAGLLLVIAVSWRPDWFPYWQVRRHWLLAAVFGMAAGPLLVTLLKELNAYHCPWDLYEFGGGAAYSSDWFVPASQVGHCFPGGHAASGFSLIALYFLTCTLHETRWRRRVLFISLLIGSSFSLVRLAQGAHFISHNLWAAALCWCLSALSFALTEWLTSRRTACSA